jgi:hypothetical protein
MKEPTYRDALRASWRLAWQHKNVWPFGLFAMLLGQFGLVELLTKIYSVFFAARHRLVWETCQTVFTKQGLRELGVLFQGGLDQWIWVIWMICMIIGLGFGLLFVASVTQGALVFIGTRYAKSRIGFPDEAKAWHVGARHVWRVMGLNLVRKVCLWFAVLWAAMASYQLSINPTGFSHVLFWLAFSTALLVGMISSIVMLYAVGYVVKEEYGFFSSIGAGWRLFFHHPLVSLETAAITLFLNVGFLLFGMVMVLYLFILPNLIGTNLVILFGAPIVGKVIGVTSYGIFLAVMLAASALFTVFTTTVWAFLFAKMHHGNFISRLVRSIRR